MKELFPIVMPLVNVTPHIVNHWITLRTIQIVIMLKGKIYCHHQNFHMLVREKTNSLFPELSKLALIFSNREAPTMTARFALAI